MEYNFKPIFRSLLTSKQFQNEKCLKVWIWCLLKATDNDFTAYVGMQEVEVKEGQFLFGRKRASEELNMSESSVYRWMKYLEKDGCVNIKTNNKYSVVTLTNHPKFKDILNRLLNNKRTTNEQQKDTYNKDKKEKKEYISKDIDKSEYGNKDINSLLKVFTSRGISMTKQKLNRFAANRLIKQHGIDKMIAAAEYALSIQGENYAPQITNILDLEEKLPKLSIYKRKEQNGRTYDIPTA